MVVTSPASDWPIFVCRKYPKDQKSFNLKNNNRVLVVIVC